MVSKNRRASKGAESKITRKVQYRFPGIDRSGSKGVYKLETELALARRQLKAWAKNHTASVIDGLYKQLTPGNRRRLTEYGHLLLGTPKKK